MAFEKCKRCGYMHYSTDPCRESEIAVHAQGGSSLAERFESVPVSAKGLASPAKVRDADTANTKDALTTQAEGRIRVAAKPKFDRNAYQRAYMREWRKRKSNSETNA